MGNRAYVIFHEPKSGRLSPAVYLHWNGGPESVYAFLAEHDRRKCRIGDVEYGAARFAHIVCDFFDQDEAGSTSVGISNPPKSADPVDLQEFAESASDNGIYLVSQNGNGLKVRRFRPVFLRGNDGRLLDTQPPPREMPPEEVQTEKEEALAHRYNQRCDGEETVAEFFQRVRPKVAAH